MRWADHHDPQKGGPAALDTAAFKGDLEEVKKLLEAGADINIVDAKGWTPLHDAVIQGHTAIVKLLIAAGANVNAQDNEERTPRCIKIDGGIRLTRLRNFMEKPSLYRIPVRLAHNLYPSRGIYSILTALTSSKYFFASVSYFAMTGIK